MKNQTIALLLILITGIFNATTLHAEVNENLEDKTTITTEVQQQTDREASENLINKIEAAQKEQMMKFVQKKHLVHESDYI